MEEFLLDLVAWLNKLLEFIAWLLSFFRGL